MQIPPFPENFTSFDTSIFQVIQTVLRQDGKQPCGAVEHTNFRPNANDDIDKKIEMNLICSTTKKVEFKFKYDAIKKFHFEDLLIIECGILRSIISCER